MSKLKQLLKRNSDFKHGFIGSLFVIIALAVICAAGELVFHFEHIVSVSNWELGMLIFAVSAIFVFVELCIPDHYVSNSVFALFLPVASILWPIILMTGLFTDCFALDMLAVGMLLGFLCYYVCDGFVVDDDEIDNEDDNKNIKHPMVLNLLTIAELLRLRN